MIHWTRTLLASLALALLGACAGAPDPLASIAAGAPTIAASASTTSATAPTRQATAIPTPTAQQVAAPAPVAPVTATSAAAPTRQATAISTPTAQQVAAPTPSAAPGPPLVPPTATPGFPEARIGTETLAALRPLRAIGLGGAVHAAIAPDNRLLAVATTAGVAIFELPSLRHLRLDPIRGGVRRVAFSADGQTLLVTRATELELQRRRVADGSLEGVEPASFGPYPSTIVSPSGDLQANLAIPDSVPIPRVTITRVADGAIVYADDDTLTMSFSPDSATAALVTFAGEVRLVDLASGAATAALALPAYWGVGFSPDAQTLVTTGRSVWLWDVVASTVRELPGAMGSAVDQDTLGGRQRVRSSADGDVLTVEGEYDYFEASLIRGSAWRVAGDKLTPAWQSAAGGSGIMNISTYVGAISPASDVTAYTDDGTSLGIYRAGQLLRSLRIAAGVGALAFSPDGALLAIGDRAGQVQLVAVADGAESQLGQAEGEVFGLVFSPDGALLGVRRADDTIEVFQLGEAGPVARVQDAPAQEDHAKNAAGRDQFLFTADGELLIAWDFETVRFYRLSDGRLLHTLPEGAQGLAIGPRRRLLALLRDQRVELWGIP